MKTITKILLLLAIPLVALAGPPVTWGPSSSALFFTPNLLLTSSGPSILSGTVNPSSVATSAVAGSIYMNTSSGVLYIKTDSGSSTNWQGVPAGSMSNPFTTLGDTLYENSTPAPARLAGNTTATKKFYTQTGTGTISAVPAWATIAATDLPNPGASSLGGIQSFAAVSNSWINTISTSGVPSATQPAFTNISGNLAVAQLPSAETWPSSGTVQATTPNQYGVLISGSGATATVLAPDASTTKVLTSGGASANPTWASVSVPMLNWATGLTFTMNNAGTVTSSNFFYRRVGDSMEVRGDFTVGTTAGSVCSLTLPNTYVIDTTKLPSNASGTKLGEATDIGGSSSGLFGSSITSDIFFDSSDTAKVYFAYTSSGTGTFTKNNCNNIWNSNEQISLFFSVPVTVWAF